MTRALLLVAALASCDFAQRHQAVTAGVVAGAIGFGSCEMDDVAVKTCGIIGGTAALALGGIAALVTWLADTTDHTLPPDEEITPTGALRIHTHAEPPPVIADAGVDGTAADASSDAMIDAP